MAQHTEEAQAHGADAATAAGSHGADAAAGHGASAAHGGGEAVGMPQLDVTTFPNQIFWLLVTLVAIYYILSRIALPRIAAVLAERQGTMTNDVAAAEELKLKATEAEAAYEKALAEARSEANRISEETKAEMQAELDEALAKANAQIAERTSESEKRIADIREGAMQSVEEVARDTAQALVSALGWSADDATVNEAVQNRMKGQAR
ncbi:F0F1 ATP synthase subunit B' [Tranquillimonas rosea]|uniref:F0F1 ATP synthase subunit B' n=1 Tax=Tranquillimonas rosea TaxID=641238 RepID=UPI003BAA5698